MTEILMTRAAAQVAAVNSSRVEVVIPSADRSGLQLDATVRDDAAARVRGLLAEWGGGTTTVEGKGTWIDPATGREVAESVSVIGAYGPSFPPLSLLTEVAAVVLAKLDQSSVAVVCDGDMFFFEAASRSPAAYAA